MTRALRSLSGLGRNFIVLCLAAAFAFSAVGAPSPDRLTRRQQRNRTQRQSRQRVCASLSHCPSAFHSNFQRAAQPADPPPAHIAATVPPPSFSAVALVLRPAPARRAALPVHPPALPRPPPALA